MARATSEFFTQTKMIGEKPVKKDLSNEDCRTAMMVLEYCNDQMASDDFKTGIPTQDLVWLAHSILQYGVKNLTKEQKAQLAHLQCGN
jgi:predicted component of type VI protein secretion system